MEPTTTPPTVGCALSLSWGLIGEYDAIDPQVEELGSQEYGFG